MDLMNSIIDFFGLQPDIVTFTDFVIWFVKMFMGFTLTALVTKFLFSASWKIERGLR